eukprot:1191631-Rhodomonas_salina.5
MSVPDVAHCWGEYMLSQYRTPHTPFQCRTSRIVIRAQTMSVPQTQLHISTTNSFIRNALPAAPSFTANAHSSDKFLVQNQTACQYRTSHS